MLLGFKKTLRLSHHHKSLKSQLIKFALILLTIVTLHTIAMMIFEKMSFIDALWLTITSVTTVGYGDLYANSFYGRISTIILIYICGIAILAQVAVMYFEHQQEIRNSKLNGDWSWKMNNHIVFLNSPNVDGEEYFYKAISEIRNGKSSLANLPIIIVSETFTDGISERLRKLHVNHVRNYASDLRSLEDADILSANTIVIIAPDQSNKNFDSMHFDLVDRLREMGVKGRIICEVVKDENRKRLRKAGADNVIRPIRSYPELLTRSIVAPGSEQILESLFDNYMVQCIRYDIQIEAKWIKVIESMTKNDIGVPIAYEDQDRHIKINPSSQELINSCAIFVILGENKVKDSKKIKDLILKSI